VPVMDQIRLNASDVHLDTPGRGPVVRFRSSFLSPQKGSMATDVFADVGAAKSYESGKAISWGLASLGLGAVTLLTAPVTLVFNVLLWRLGSAGGISKVQSIIAAVVGLLIMLGLAGSGIIFGM
jgi:hypothetical protein